MNVIPSSKLSSPSCTRKFVCIDVGCCDLHVACLVVGAEYWAACRSTELASVLVPFGYSLTLGAEKLALSFSGIMLWTTDAGGDLEPCKFMTEGGFELPSLLESDGGKLGTGRMPMALAWSRKRLALNKPTSSGRWNISVKMSHVCLAKYFK